MTAITVNAPFQVVHDGVVYTPGQTADVPDDLANTWIDAGWVTKAETARAHVHKAYKRQQNH